MLDAYEILKNKDEIFFKTDTHMNIRGSCIVYYNFIEQINKLYNLNLVPKIINLEKKTGRLRLLNLAGDLTNPTNLREQYFDCDIDDTCYFSDDVIQLFCSYKIENKNNIRLLTYDLKDETQQLEEKQETLHWDIISKYIIYKNTNNNASKILIFYDSFLLNTLSLYLDLFENIYFVKNKYDNDIINKINPAYVFRIERLLC